MVQYNFIVSGIFHCSYHFVDFIPNIKMARIQSADSINQIGN